MMENDNIINEDFNYDETVEIIDQEKCCVYEGKVISIRGELLIVFNNTTRQEEKHYKNENTIIKLWEPGRPFQIFNRIDLKISNTDYWVVGMVIDINKEREQLCIRYSIKDNELKEEWINAQSLRIAPIGYHTRSICSRCTLSVEEINKKLFKNRKFITLNQVQEQNFRKNIEKSNFFIKETEGDGNCMFRSISDQIYGNEEYHKIIREKCMDYLLMERNFFSQFIEGGDKEFDNYINMKRELGVWGDDIELQALSEIYDRPIEIYSGTNKPLKTFHENKKEFNLKNRDENNKEREIKYVKISPIRISYHGSRHYNSVIPTKIDIEVWKNYKSSMLTTSPGEYEDNILKIKKEQKLTKKEKAKEEENEIEESRKIFIKEKDKYLDDMLLDLLLNEGGKNDKSIIEQSKLEYQKEQNDILQKVINDSIKENQNKEEKEKKGTKLAETDYYSNPVIQSALEFGFSLEEAIMAWTIYGDNQDLVLQYLYSTQSHD